MSDYSPAPLPPSSPMPSTSHTSTMAIISLIGGITGFTVLPFLGSLAGIIFGHIAKSEIKKSNGMIGGNGMATAGLVMGYIAMALWCIGCVVYAIIMIAALGTSGYYN